MINGIKVIKKQATIVEVNILRNGCRMAARHYKKKGNLQKVKRWNDVAYIGDLAYGQLKN